MAGNHMPEGWFAVGTIQIWPDDNNVIDYEKIYIENPIKSAAKKFPTVTLLMARILSVHKPTRIRGTGSL